MAWIDLSNFMLHHKFTYIIFLIAQLQAGNNGLLNVGSRGAYEF